MSTGIEALVDDMLGEAEPGQLLAHLGPILKVRSVQDFRPSEAVSFVFRLKEAVREELSDELPPSAVASELAAFDARVDRLALLAFDVYTQCRERLHEARVNDVKRRVSGVMRRLGLGLDELDPGPDVPVSDLGRHHSQGSAEQ